MEVYKVKPAPFTTRYKDDRGRNTFTAEVVLQGRRYLLETGLETRQEATRVALTACRQVTKQMLEAGREALLAMQNKAPRLNGKSLTLEPV